MPGTTTLYFSVDWDPKLLPCVNSLPDYSIVIPGVVLIGMGGAHEMIWLATADITAEKALLQGHDLTKLLTS